MSAQDSISLLLSAVNLGVIGVSGYVLYRVWNVIEKQQRKEIPSGWMKALLATMVFTILLVLISAGVELTKLFASMRSSEEIAQSLATQKAVIEEARGIVCQSLFDPQPVSDGIDKYRGRAPNGLEQRVKKDPVFQDFKGRFLVQRLWAEPTDENSLIRAWKPKTEEECLMVEFCRKGNGCDVTLKPRDNEAIKTGSFSRMIVKAQQDGKGNCKKPIAFHIRIIDGRGNHWAWGDPGSLEDGTYPSVHFSLLDATGKPTVLKRDEPDEFVFDISSRKKWTAFEADGTIAPLQAAGERFTCVQGVVIEPGIFPEGGELAATDPTVKDPHTSENRRKVASSPGNETSLMRILYVGFR